MKKTLSLLLVLMLTLSVANVSAFATNAQPAAETKVEFVDPNTFNKPYDVNEVIVEADETTGQIRLEARTKEIIEADGLKFKDLNANGELDAYEDWRLTSEERASNLLSLMNDDEKIGLLWHASTGGTFSSMYPYTEEWLYSNESIYIDADGNANVPMYHSIISDHVTTYLHNVNGTPETLIYENNAIQEIAESARLGVPVVLSCDRSYNTFAGQVNMANYAFGIAHDEELLYDLVAQYAKEERALGFHLPFHSYGVEIGSWYGDDPNYIAKMVGIETKAYQENGVNATTKHFMARGGRSSYANAKSPANLLDSWLVGWKSAVIDNGSGWVMLNGGTLLNDCAVWYDAESVALLRETLGYDGCVVTDWPVWLFTPGTMGSLGTAPDGRNLDECSVAELYAYILNADVDQIGCFFMVEEGTPIDYDAVTEKYPNTNQPMWPEEIKTAVNEGYLTWETIEKHCFRVLRNKFDLGLFEDPYSNLDEALELIASDAYKAEAFDLMTIDDIYAARAERTNELEIRLQTESSVLLKNDNDLLPLSRDAKIYVDGTTKETVDMDKEAIGAYATVVDNFEDADVIIAHVTAMDDATELVVEDANDAKKPLVLVFDGGVSSEPDAWTVTHSDAVLFLTYDCTPDHGSSMGNIYHKTLPSVLADMLYGEKEPTGSLVYEMAWDSDDALLDWGELQKDTGVSTETRLYMAAMARNNPTIDMPNNLGDVMFTTDFGMSYTEKADIVCDTLVIPQSVVSYEEEGSSGVNTVTAAREVIKAGEPFSIYFIAQNNGAGDGTVDAVVTDNGAPVAEKFVALDAGQFRVINIELTLEAGEHEIEVLGMTKTLNVQ